MIRFRCPSCRKKFRTKVDADVLRFTCPVCGNESQITVTHPGNPFVDIHNAPTVWQPPRPVQKPEPQESDPGFPESPLAEFVASHFFKGAWTVVGFRVGAGVGYASAHHFALYGGFLLLGQPYSPARYQLVPGHMLLWAIMLSVLGFVGGALLDFVISLMRSEE